MPETPLRFVHASDFHLETPFGGLSYVPDHLRDVLIDAPYEAASRVFEIAMTEDVDLVLLAGDILDPLEAGPRAIDFMRRQLRRLADRQIAVYWATGAVDGPSRWPKAIPLPANVRWLADESIGPITHERNGEPLALIVGVNRGRTIGRKELHAALAERYCIAVAHGRPSPKELRHPAINYWALGGKHSAHTASTAPSVAQFSGSPQGRRASEDGAHGCMLVELNAQREANAHLVPTDAVRWHNESLQLTDGMTVENFERALREGTGRLAEASSGRQVLVCWSITSKDGRTDERLAAGLRHGGLGDELLGKLQSEFGMSTPGVWTARLEIEPTEVLPTQWYDEDTILGEFLRLVRHYQENEQEPLVEVESFLSSRRIRPELAAALKLAGPRERREILRHVAALGSELLRGERH